MLFYAATLGAMFGVVAGIFFGGAAVWGCLLGAGVVLFIGAFPGRHPSPQSSPPEGRGGSSKTNNQPSGTHKPFSPQGEKVPEGRMRGGGKQSVRPANSTRVPDRAGEGWRKGVGEGWRKSSALVAIFLIIASLGALRSVWNVQTIAEQVARQSAAYDRQAVVEGVVQNDPASTATSVRAILAVSSINKAPMDGLVLVSLPANTPLAYGDRIKIRGLLQAPQTFQTNTGREFDYPHYLNVQGVTSVVMRAVLFARIPPAPSLVGTLFSLRHSFERSLERSISEPAAALLEGIELGDKNAMPKDLNQAFISSGLVHMVVLSGYNLSVVSEAVLRALSFLPQVAALSVGGIGMILFAIMTGGGAATVRALMMGLIAILARYFGRSADALRALAFAAAAMALWSPLSVLYDPSFILSMLATLGLILLSPTVEGWVGGFLGGLRKDPHPNPLPGGEGATPATSSLLANLRAIAASTISVQIFVLPALLYFTGIFSFVSIPANLLALPIVPFTMLAGFITGLCGLVSQSLALIPALATTAALQWIILVATTAAALPFATFTLPSFPAYVIAIAYIPLTWWALRVYLKKE